MSVQATCACHDNRHDLCLNKEHCQCRCHKLVKMYRRGIHSWIVIRDELYAIGCTDTVVEALIGTQERDAAARAEAGIP